MSLPHLPVRLGDEAGTWLLPSGTFTPHPGPDGEPTGSLERPAPRRARAEGVGELGHGLSVHTVWTRAGGVQQTLRRADSSLTAVIAAGHVHIEDASGPLCDPLVLEDALTPLALLAEATLGSDELAAHLAAHPDARTLAGLAALI